MWICSLTVALIWARHSLRTAARLCNPWARWSYRCSHPACESKVSGRLVGELPCTSTKFKTIVRCLDGLPTIGWDEFCNDQYWLFAMYCVTELWWCFIWSRPIKGSIIIFSDRFKVIAFATHHRVPSHGYALICTWNKFLPEFKTLSKKEISALRQQGVKVTQSCEEIVLVYTGDITMEGLLIPENRFIFSAPVLIIE